MRNKNITKADAIRVATDVSPDLSNKAIKRKVLEMFGKDVSDTQIVNTVGSFRYRTRTLKKEIIDAAKSLYDLCGQDRKLVFRAINKYCL